MRRPELRTIRRTFVGTWLAAGVLAMGYGLLSAGCTPVTPAVELLAPAGEIDSVHEAEQAWRAETIATHEPIWREENGPGGESFSAGLAAYRLASATLDPAWANQAIDAFDRALRTHPDFAPARAWRGSAHALMARDFPVKGLWQIIPGPGFVRLFHVKAAFADLDSAVDAAPDDPVIRLIRAATYLSMPSVFGSIDEGLADFDRLRVWTRDPDSHPDFSDILRSPSWREDYFLARARAMGAIGESEDAVRSWKRLSETTDNPTLQELAKWHLISLGAS